MTRPLDGVRIVDLSNMLMAPYTTQIMGDMGASVIKVEPPEGDAVRGIGPQRNQGMGAIFLNVNRSKRSIVLNLKSDDGLAAVKQLIKDADILVYNRRPQAMSRLGLSYEEVCKINPNIIYAGLYGYGQSGPYAHKPAFDDLIQGAVAIPSFAQRADGRSPAYAPTAIVDRGVGLWAVGQITAALYFREKTGKGQSIDMPMFEMMASFVLGDHLAGGTFVPPEGGIGYPRMLNPDRRPYETSDGHICVMVYTDKHWRSFFKAQGKEDQMDKDPRFASMSTRTENIAEIYAELAALLKSRTTEDWLSFFDTADIPAMPLHTPESLLKDPHLQEVGFFTEIDHPTEGLLTEMSVPASWSETQPAPTGFAPRLGEHSEEILLEIGFAKSKISEMLKSGVTSSAQG
jgi:crotonobetainyl-CoA:carnitine CoA-transferase CaiB-like acyl-CoA transferase